MKTKTFEFTADYHCEAFMEYLQIAPVDYEITGDLEVTVEGAPYDLRKLRNIYNRIVADED